ncbi:extracellular solute-binding protein [Aquibacillus salsiterrae]|uniref:Extracellular solute-binding protein n=1 Tax=Aquibacillus salsiterrae TaxID=2950439 RepID=A0A9X3WEH0_9BACI|nr:extracellular solute-binding protein [Aquibacillus salsiterrae]MDC3418352.1 extracellular solute-binding protein [Aquibacillus salsiterrae]
MKKSLGLLIVTVFMLVFSVACSNESGGESSGEKGNNATGEAGTGPLNVSLTLMGGPKTPDAWVNEALAKDLTDHLDRDVTVEDIFLPSWSDAKTKINLMMSDKSSMPDVLWFWDMNKEYKQWVDAGVLQDLTPYLQSKGQNIINYYNRENLFYSWDPSGKIYRIPGDVSEPGTMTTMIRKDWLDNLGLDVPTTIDEYVDVLRAFTFDDPDGNGKDDTYGISGENLYRAFAPFFYAYGVDVEQFMIQDDGTIKYGSLMPETREVLELLQGLYKEGVIDPRVLTNTEQQDVDDIMANGKIGSIYRWVAFFNPESTYNLAFKEKNPDGEYIAIDPIKGPSGFSSDVPSDAIGWSFLSVTGAAEEPETVVDVIDRMASPETYRLITFGQEGELYTIDENGVYDSKLSVDERNKLGLGNYNWYVQRKDEANLENTPEVNELFAARDKSSRPMREKIFFVKSLNRPMWTEYATDINTLRDETFWGIISGNLPITAYDDFVDQYGALGGDKIDEETNKLYSEQKNQWEEFNAWYDENIEPYK